MTLGEAAILLAEISQSSVRQYSTHDFGRERDAKAISVVVRKNRSRQMLTRLRNQLGPRLIAFIGTTSWLGDEKHIDGHEIVVASGESQFDMLRVARSDAVNFGMETEALITKLKEYDQLYGIQIFHAETDTIEFEFTKLPENMPAFCKDLYKFCPDIVDQGVGTVEGLQEEIQKSKEVFLWWD